MTYLKQTITKALAVIAALIGGCMTASADTVTEGFDDFNASYDAEWHKTLMLPEGWNFYGDASLFVRDDDTYKTKRPAIMIEGANSECYLITPELSGDFSFYLRNRTKNYQASATAYTCTYANGEMTLGTEIGNKKLNKTSSGQPTWEKVSFTASTGTRIALLLSNAIFDDFTYTTYQASAEPVLTVADYVSGSSYDFGTVPAGTTRTFKLWNGGLADLTINSITITGGYSITIGANLTTIASKGTAEVTIATPAADAEGVLTITSNDANSPYTIALKSTYKVPAPIMGIDLTEIIFGVVTADASQTVTVSNTGDAELTASVVSDNSDFTVSDENLTVAAGESKTFTITYHYQAENYGGHAATITITPNIGKAVTISASASIKDPNAWSEDFSGNALPQGWEIIGSKWSFTNEEASGTYEPNGYLVTPKLKVQTGQVMTFQARSKQYGTDLIVQCQKDGGEWITKLTKSFEGSSAYETYTIGNLEAGIYRFRIATENLCVDNFEGFQLVPSTVVKETWWVSYTFSHGSSEDEMISEIDTEEMEVELEDDNIAFKFPEPIKGGTWMRGTKATDGSLVFASGQFIGKYSGDNVYFYGFDGESLTSEMVFYPNADGDAFLCAAILLNASTTSVSYYGIFTNAVVSKTKPEPSGITTAKNNKPETRNGVYDMLGRKVNKESLPKGIFIINGKKYIQK